MTFKFKAWTFLLSTYHSVDYWDSIDIIIAGRGDSSKKRLKKLAAFQHKNFDLYER